MTHLDILLIRLSTKAQNSLNGSKLVLLHLTYLGHWPKTPKAIHLINFGSTPIQTCHRNKFSKFNSNLLLLLGSFFFFFFLSYMRNIIFS
jgi:hypothetical protein